MLVKKHIALFCAAPALQGRLRTCSQMHCEMRRRLACTESAAARAKRCVIGHKIVNYDISERETARARAHTHELAHSISSE